MMAERIKHGITLFPKTNVIGLQKIASFNVCPI